MGRKKERNRNLRKRERGEEEGWDSVVVICVRDVLCM
jgi:hypothetical protein